ncbi:MAG TPA: acyltransferase [Usitatibacter sp.]|nr:acyltransferase [Usitatibacter sp.]
MASAAPEGVRAAAGPIGAIDGLRGICVLWVMLFHYLVLCEGTADPWIAAAVRVPGLERTIRSGPYAVDLFFLISGFLLTLPWLIARERGAPAPDARRFYARRLQRIVPAYYVHLALLFALVLPLLRGWLYWRADAYVDVWNVIAHALFLHNTSPLTSGTLGVNGALWTLAVEAQFYALLPFVAPAFARAPWRTLVAALAVTAAWTWAARHDLRLVVDAYLGLGRHWSWPEEVVRRLLAIQLPAYVADFALGAMAGRAWRSAMGGSRALPVLAMLAGVLALGTLQGFQLAPLGEQSWMAALTALAAILWGVAADKSGIARLLLARGPLAFMGRISYSTYLWHLPLLLLLQEHGPAAGSAAVFPLYLASAVAAGWISWKRVEQPFMRAAGRASPRPAP